MQISKQCRFSYFRAVAIGGEIPSLQELAMLRNVLASYSYYMATLNTNISSFKFCSFPSLLAIE